MARRPLLELSAKQAEVERRRALEKDAAERRFEQRRRRVLWQCAALLFIGVPFYGYSWHLTDPREAELPAALGFLLSYAGPFFRWVLYLVGESEEFRR